MKTTIDIPDEILEDAIKYSHATTKRDAVVTALTEYNQRHRMALLAKHLGTCQDLMTIDELRSDREAD